ncbi:ImmA/IrrE family metallo-endopeptidase [Brachyspira pilosicoli]|uniref:ImmA/IrrE family metallo-endopeptidase n=1 Tax=Brachyspira pilosicoli TaxID=52584 RepID=UPI002431B238|nr:ImmA/IrrE family metallo-endopeptidase [Brachyspira pilosicoli]
MENTTEKGNKFEKKVYKLLKKYINDDKYYINPKKSIVIHKYVCKKEDNNYRDINFDIVIKIYNTEEEKIRAEKGEDIKHYQMIAVECKSHNRNLSVQNIEYFHTQIEKSKAKNGIIISESDFTEEAISIAKQLKIDLIVINNQNDIILKRNEDNYIYYSMFEILLKFGILDKTKQYFSKIKIPFISEKEIINIITKNFDYFSIYKHDRLDTNKVIYFLSNQYNINFEFNINLGNKILGLISLKKNTIFISNQLEYDSPRWRFTLAHEIGHFILHKKYLEKYMDIFEDNITDIFLENDIIQKNLNKKMEIQANIFASNFLINNRYLEIHWNNFRVKYYIIKNFLFFDNQYINKTRVRSLIEYIKYTFGVSEYVAVIKLVNLGILKIDKSIGKNICSINDVLVELFNNIF